MPLEVIWWGFDPEGRYGSGAIKISVQLEFVLLHQGNDEVETQVLHCWGENTADT